MATTESKILEGLDQLGQKYFESGPIYLDGGKADHIHSDPNFLSVDGGFSLKYPDLGRAVSRKKLKELVILASRARTLILKGTIPSSRRITRETLVPRTEESDSYVGINRSKVEIDVIRMGSMELVADSVSGGLDLVSPSDLAKASRHGIRHELWVEYGRTSTSPGFAFGVQREGTFNWQARLNRNGTVYLIRFPIPVPLDRMKQTEAELISNSMQFFIEETEQGNHPDQVVPQELLVFDRYEPYKIGTIQS